jgi:hypothetical protein
MNHPRRWRAFSMRAASQTWIRAHFHPGLGILLFRIGQTADLQVSAGASGQSENESRNFEAAALWRRDMFCNAEPMYGLISLKGSMNMDFMTITTVEGCLVVNGDRIKSAPDGSAPAQVVIDASMGPGILWLRDVHLPIEIHSPEHGNFSVAPARGAAMLPLLAGRGVLTALELKSGLRQTPGFNTEAILGFIGEMRVADNRLVTRTGCELSPNLCRGVLARLGARLNERVDNETCLQVFNQLGLPGPNGAGFISKMFGLAGVNLKQLQINVGILERRGYQIRCNHRMSSICRPSPREFQLHA